MPRDMPISPPATAMPACPRPISGLSPLSSISPRRRAASGSPPSTPRSPGASVRPRSTRASRQRPQGARAATRRQATAPAAAAVVIDVATGQVLARAQVPDLDPADSQLAGARWPANDAELAGRFRGAYGPGPTRPASQGMFQAGSVAKLFTALAAARAGWSHAGVGCELSTDIRFGCRERDARGPLFTLPGWPKPIHDFYKDHPHGELDLVQALAVSCNVYFGQLGLALGPEPFRALAGAGLEIGYGATGSVPAGRPGHAAARVDRLRPGRDGDERHAGGAPGRGDRRRRRLPLLPADACELAARVRGDARSSTIRRRSARSSPVCAASMTDGTGAPPRASPPAVRIYGKTGTADAPRFAARSRSASRARDRAAALVVRRPGRTRRRPRMRTGSVRPPRAGRGRAAWWHRQSAGRPDRHRHRQVARPPRLPPVRRRS